MRKIFWCTLWIMAATSTVNAQLPTSQLMSLFPSGAAPSSTTEITISGNNLDDTSNLVFSHDGIQAEQKTSDPTPFDEGPQPVENSFIVTVADNVPPGRYEVRSLGKYGLSNPRCFVIGGNDELIEVEPNGGIDLPQWQQADDGQGNTTREIVANEAQVPSTINGQSGSGADVDWFFFRGKGGQKLLVEGFAKRIDSQIDLSLALFDAAGKLIGQSRFDGYGDPLISATLPADGDYFIRAHDALYRGGSGFHYRLELGTHPHLDFVFPPMGLPGSNEEYTVYGSNLPGGSASPMRVDDVVLESATVRIAIPADSPGRLEFNSLIQPHQGAVDGVEFRMAAGGAKSNPLLLTIADAPVVREQPNNDTPDSPQPLTLPCEVAGQFYPQRDADWFSFDAKEGDQWVIDVTSQRLGIPTDPALLIQRVSVDGEGNETISVVQYLDDVTESSNNNNRAGRHEFDYRTADPYYLFTAPADGTYRLMIRDGHSSVKSDPRLVYRLAIRKPAPDMQVVAVPLNSNGSLLLRRGGRNVIRIFAFRRDDYDGEIHVSCSGLPAGVTSEEIAIGPGNNTGSLILTTADDAPPSISPIQVVAKANINGKEVIRQARYGSALEPFQFSQANANIGSVRSRIVDQIQACVTDYDPAPIRLSIGEEKTWETSRGGRINIPYQVKRAEGTSGNLTAVAVDIPPSSSVGQLNIGGNEKGEFELRLLAATPPGTYTIYLGGFNQGYRYSRNPELAEQAKQRQERIGKILTDSQNKAREAQQAVNQKQTELTQATNTVNQAKPKKDQADQALKDAESTLAQAEKALQERQQTLAANAEDENAKTQFQQAQTARDQAGEKLKQMRQAAEQATKDLQQAEMQLKTAQEAKTKADEELSDAQAFQQQAQQEKQRADQFASQKRNESNPRNINHNVPSNSLTIKVTEFPIKVDALPAELTIKQGEKIEVPVKLTRLYDFNANVSIQARSPGGVGGLSFQSLNLGGDKREGKFELSAQTNATAGQHECTVRLQMNFNGQNLTMERPLQLTVVEVKEEK